MQARRFLVFAAVVLALAAAAAYLSPTSKAQAQSANAQPAAAQAQQHNQNGADDADYDDDDSAVPLLSVSVTLNQDGTVALLAYELGPAYASADLKPALEAALGCVLQDSRGPRLAPGGYIGKCRLASSPLRLLREYRIATAPLREYARLRQLQSITLQVALPDTELRETAPATKNTFFGEKQVPEKVRRKLQAIHVFTWRPDTADMPQFVVMRVGYSPATIAHDAALLAATLFVPILLALWLRRRALTADVADKAPVWFSYIRYQQWLLNGALLAWWATVESTHLAGYIRFLLAPVAFTPGWVVPALATLANWIPPAIVWVICVTISQPVQEKLRGLTWTRKELALQATYSLCTALLPLLLMILGLLAATRGDFRRVVVFFAAAFVLKLIAASKLVKLLGMHPQALTIGELRDAAFAMAQRLGVKLQQIYVIPAGKAQMANAFARKGNTIAFTDYLLRRMSRREVNYILAHELNHLRLKHVQKLSGAIVGCLVAAVTLEGAFRGVLPDSIFFRYGLIFLMVTLVPYFCSRRFEFAADAGAVQTTGDAPAAISALFKLSTLNMHPLQWSKWSEKWLTHPSTLRRAQAIARKASIPLEQIASIAQTAVSDDAHYPIPDSAVAANRLHPSHKKASDVRQMAFAAIGVWLLTPTAFALLVKFVPMTPAWDRIVYLAGAVVTLAAYLSVVNVMATRRIRSLMPLLKAKLQKGGIDPEASNGIPVALAPNAMPRSYEGHMHWDLGYLFFGADRIAYCGEETHFALRRDQITNVQLGPGAPHLIRVPRVYIAWRDAERDACGVFSLSSAAPTTLYGLRRPTQNLLQRLLAWRKESFAAPNFSEQLAHLPAPQFGNVTGKSPLLMRKSEKVVKELYLTALLAAAAAVFAGLPFHISAFFANPDAFASRPHPPGSGWYVVLVAVTIRVIQYIPIFRYKDVPVVTASLPAKNADRPAATQQNEPKRQPEPALR